MNQQHNKKVAVIDLDGTLIRGQIQHGLIMYFFSKKVIGLYYVIKLNIFFILYKFHLISKIDKIYNYGVKYLKGMNLLDVNKYIDEYIETKVIYNIFPASFRLIKNLKSEGYYVIILSSAIDIVVSKIATMFDVDDYICTKLEKDEDTLTGYIKGDIVYGPNKVSVLERYLSHSGNSLNDVEAYADHESDIPLLKKVKKAYVANPDGRMRRLSIINKFDIIDMNKL